jgi:7,8-dihydropterin-6-yl-methyl-4-(beta-D-ribofuranosyl)aminobenzene 5'-phosphate synthase
MRRYFLQFTLLLFPLSIFSSVTAAQQRDISVKIIYDNLWHDDRLEFDWGFAALIEIGDRTVLLDTGTQGDMFMRNLRTLEKDPAEIDALVISHAHGDHTGGMEALFALGARPTVYLLEAFPQEFRQQTSAMTTVVESEPGDEIVPGVFTTGQVGQGIPEQAVAIETGVGLVVITGCAHPGVVEMTQRVRDLSEEPIHLVMGGFHLIGASGQQVRAAVQGLQALEVEKVGVTHCSGMEAIDAFSRQYRSSFVPLGVGRVLTFPSPQ